MEGIFSTKGLDFRWSSPTDQQEEFVKAYSLKDYQTSCHGQNKKSKKTGIKILRISIDPQLHINGEDVMRHVVHETHTHTHLTNPCFIPSANNTLSQTSPNLTKRSSTTMSVNPIDTHPPSGHVGGQMVDLEYQLPRGDEVYFGPTPMEVGFIGHTSLGTLHVKHICTTTTTTAGGGDTFNGDSNTTAGKTTKKGLAHAPTHNHSHKSPKSRRKVHKEKEPQDEEDEEKEEEEEEQPQHHKGVHTHVLQPTPFRSGTNLDTTATSGEEGIPQLVRSDLLHNDWQKELSFLTWHIQRPIGGQLS